METNEEKFERTRRKFRSSMKNAQKNQRRTVFLEDEEVPSTSQRGARRKQHQRVPRTTPEPPASPPSAKVRLGRMTVVTSEETAPPPPSCRELRCYDEETVPPPPPLQTRSNDYEETAPPPPPYIDHFDLEDNSMETTVETPPPPLWEPEDFTLDDLNINPEDLGDPMIEEFVRTFCGATDSTVNTRPPSPPSPDKSFSSVDWENENFRPPTPPRKKRFGMFEIKDKQYSMAGMTCYERVWRARILVPQTKSPLAITQSANGPSHVHKPTVQAASLATPSSGPITSYASSSPPEFITAPTNQSATTYVECSLEQLPLKLHEEIAWRRANAAGKRVRFSREMDGRWYRITIAQGGAIRVAERK